MVLALGPLRQREPACHGPAPAAAPPGRRRDRRPNCRWNGGLLALLGAALLAACLPADGWRRTDRRACEPEGTPPILCLTAQDDGPYELRVGDAVLLPGECLQAPPEAGGGRLAVTLHASGREIARRRVRLAESVRTTVRIAGERVRVIDEQRCDGRVPTP